MAIDGQVEVTLSERPGQEQETDPPADDTAVGSGTRLGIAHMTLAPEVAQAMELPEDQQGALVREVVGSSPANAPVPPGRFCLLAPPIVASR